jgi:hypothetical protein
MVTDERGEIKEDSKLDSNESELNNKDPLTKYKDDEDIDYFELEDPDEYPEYYESEVINELAASNQKSIEIKREDTRGQLAVIYTIATFIVFILGFAVSILDAAWRQTSIIENLSAVLPLISGIFLGTLGFVLGYYFRQSEEE